MILVVQSDYNKLHVLMLKKWARKIVLYWSLETLFENFTLFKTISQSYNHPVNSVRNNNKRKFILHFDVR